MVAQSAARADGMVQKTAHGQGSPFLRGFTGYRTLTLIDGVRYNNSIYRDGPNEYFSLIDFNSVEQIKLLNGPAGVLYGSDVIDGTLNLQTKSSRFADAQRRYFRGSQDYRYSTADDSHLASTELDFGTGQRSGPSEGSVPEPQLFPALTVLNAVERPAYRPSP